MNEQDALKVVAGDELKLALTYKGIDVYVYTGTVNKWIYFVKYNNNPHDWPECIDIENAKKYIDILKTWGEDAANKYWQRMM